MYRSNIKNHKVKSLKKILSELKIDPSVDHLSKIEDVNQTVKKYSFEIGGNKYIVAFITDFFDNKSFLGVNFKNITAIEKLKSKKHDSKQDLYSDMDRAKYGLTNTGNSMMVFNEIFNVVGKYIVSKKPTYFSYEAVEDNRKKLYSSLIKRIEKTLPIKFNRILVNPLSGDSISATSQLTVYEMKY